MSDPVKKYPLGGALERHYAAIVEGSNDAIITKDLTGRILSWNASATRLFGYSAHEAIGRSITMLIPDDRMDEEPEIIRRLKLGERIEHFETVRKRKDGSEVPISLTISPVRDDAGVIVAASKIARDITLQKEFEQQRDLILSEMRHRVGNCFAVAGSLLSMCAREVETAQELADLMKDRFISLSAAQSMIVGGITGQTDAGVRFSKLLETICRPFTSMSIPLDGDDFMLAPGAVTTFALVLNELCTNSVKYGAMSQSDGVIVCKSSHSEDRIRIIWEERGVFEAPPPAMLGNGFGTSMSERILRGTLSGTFKRVVSKGNLSVEIEVDRRATLENET
ncbi:PAS domain S-box protein [Salipiger sp. PrR003]|uniref:PAS domain S-box protein n=1 Tax=Salipiger sp. PrR003 TaxID=2706776 RepID=UPI0013DC1DA6|nr:PAS domain S-box protein [Salipiger sp. PrR003]NDV50360.1 PAS domain S-box protein [Salipiger sp. PrR003]